MTAPERRSALDKYLREQLGLQISNGTEMQIRQRRCVGKVIHEFSHIRCSMHVDLLVLAVSSTGWVAAAS